MYRIEKFLQEETTAYEEDSLEFSLARLEVSVQKDAKIRGGITIHSRMQREMQCFFYSTHYRMQCLVGELVGKTGELLYQFDAAGLDAGDSIKGEFAILSSAGEYHIPFTVSVQQSFASTSLGEIRNLFHFANLARTSWEEAVALFYQPSFGQVFVGHDRQYYDLYRGLSRQQGNAHNVDEFLIAIHKKQAVTCSLFDEGVILKDMPAVERETLRLRRNGWGYTHINVEVTGAFIKAEKLVLEASDFTDDVCEFQYYVYSDKLHGGDNIGQLQFDYGQGKVSYQIVVHTPVLLEKKAKSRRESKELLAALMHLYMEYTTGTRDRQLCLREAEKIVEKMNCQYGRNIEARLYQTHILLEMERENEARWILTHVDNVLQNEEITQTMYAYYIYLKAKLEHEEIYEQKVKSRLKEIANTESGGYLPVIFYLRMLSPQQMNPVKRLSVFEQQYYKGANSPVFYREAWRVLEGSMAYLTKLGPFEIALVRFAIHYGLYTKEAAAQVNYLVMRKKEMTPALFEMLKVGYQTIPQDETVAAMCTLLIRTGLCRRDCFEWYALAVKKQLRITSLYEYYMLSADLHNMELPPRIVLMYFTYQCSLTEQRKAYLYSLLVSHRKEIPDLFAKYKPQIEAFVWQQLEKKNINENLAVLYRYAAYHTEDMARWASQLLSIAFKHLIRVSDRRAKRVILVQDKLAEEMAYEIENGEAYADCYTQDYEILLEDSVGNRYYDKSLWTDKKLMAAEKLALYLQQEGEASIGFLLYLTDIKGPVDSAEHELWPLYETLALSEQIELSYRQRLSDSLLHLYYERDKEKELDCFLGKYPLESATKQQRGEVIHYLILREMDEKAYEILYNYGFEGVSPKMLTRLIGRQQEDLYDERLLALIYYTFRMDKYTQEMLMYLCRYFEGNLKQMRDIWRAAVRFDVEASAIAERILQLSLFDHGYISDKQDIFAYYMEHRRRDSVARRYINRNAHEYFVKGQLPEANVFAAIERDLSKGKECDAICRIAYLYYMSKEVESYTKEQEDIICRQVVWLLLEKQYVPFLERFVSFLPWLKLYTERTYIEYRAKSGSRVSLHYYIEGADETQQTEQTEGGSYFTQQMKEVFEGYYCKSLVLFFGERLQYYFMEEKDQTAALTESGCIEKSDALDDANGSRYSMLNDLMMCESLGEEQTALQMRESYVRQDRLVEKLFGE